MERKRRDLRNQNEKPATHFGLENHGRRLLMEDTQKENAEEAMTPRAGVIAGVQKHVWRGHQRETVTENDVGLGRP